MDLGAGILIPFAVLRNCICKAGQRCINIRFGGIKIHHKRTDFCAKEMIGAGCAKRRKPFHILGVHKFQHSIAVCEMADHMLLA